FEFALRFGLPIRPVVQPPVEWLRKTNVHRAVRTMQGNVDETADIGTGKTPEEVRRARAIPPTLHDLNPITRSAYAIWEHCGGDAERIVASLYLARPDHFDQAFTAEATAR